MRLFIPILLLCLLTPASAQITGELKGIVLDSSSASVEGAKVMLTNAETGAQRSLQSDSQGRFTFGLLPIGLYELTVEASGFRMASISADVRTGEATSVQLRLEVGQLTESVTVTDAVSPLDIENAQLQNSITGASIQEIPVGRNLNQFVTMAPGIAPVSANNSFLGSGSFNANGGRGRGNNITVDGITITDVAVTGTGSFLAAVNFSSVREVKVITNNFSAEYGRNSSAQVLYLTKSGTNSLHGELYEYFQNDKLNARPFFDTTGRTNVTRVNTYGFEVGGPALLPGLYDGRNRSFWHAAYEGQKARGSSATRIALVPTPGMMAQVTDPTARLLLDQYQMPTTDSGRLTTTSPNTTDAWQFSVRGDHYIGPRDTLWVRYARYNQDITNEVLTFVQGNLPGFGVTVKSTPQQATLQEMHLFSPSLVNEFRFGFGGGDAIYPMDTTYPLGPRVQFQNAEVAPFGMSSIFPQGREQRTYQFTDNLSWTRGAHSFKFGGEYYHIQADSVLDSAVRPVFAFANWADFAAGRPAQVTQRFGDSFRENRVNNIFAFAQDDWKISRSLTLNLGMRLEWAGGPMEKDGRISNLNLDNRSSFGAAGAGPFGLLETGQQSFRGNTNWAPRAGFAWSPGGGQKTVVRGGYGIAYDFIFLSPITSQRFLPPFIVAGTITGQASFAGANSFEQIVAGTSRMQQEAAVQAGRFDESVVNFGLISPAIDQGLRNPQVQQWNFGVQRALGGFVLKANYVGTKATYLPRSRDINLIANAVPPAVSVEDESSRLSSFQAAFAGLNGNPSRRSNRIDGRYNGVVLIESSANSIYHAGQFEVQRRFSGGFLLNANYTAGKSIDDGSDVLNVLVNDSPAQQNPRDNRDNRGLSQFDLRQRFVVTHVWQMPWGVRSSNWTVRTLLAGWSFAGITSFRSGFPVTLDAGTRRGIAPIPVLGGGGQVRPNASGPVDFRPQPAGSAGAPNGLHGDPAQRISTYAAALGLSQPLLGNFGNLGRNTLRLNGETNFNWNVFKNFAVSERANLQVRAELYNVFNHTSFLDVSRNITSPNFGQYVTVAQNARAIQLAARLVF